MLKMLHLVKDSIAQELFLRMQRPVLEQLESLQRTAYASADIDALCSLYHTLIDHAQDLPSTPPFPIHSSPLKHLVQYSLSQPNLNPLHALRNHIHQNNAPEFVLNLLEDLKPLVSGPHEERYVQTIMRVYMYAISNAESVEQAVRTAQRTRIYDDSHRQLVQEALTCLLWQKEDSWEKIIDVVVELYAHLHQLPTESPLIKW